MTTVLAGLVIVAVPFLVVTALLKLAERVQDRRDLARDQQIALTDAIHWEFGAAAAPVVRRRLRGGWRVSMAVPLDRAPLVGGLVGVIRRHFAAAAEVAEPVEIVLTHLRVDIRAQGVLGTAQGHGTVDTRLAA